jgi:hypothetical protein
VDKKTQRAARTIEDNHEIALETSLDNVTKDLAPVLVYFGKDCQSVARSGPIVAFRCPKC